MRGKRFVWNREMGYFSATKRRIRRREQVTTSSTTSSGGRLVWRAATPIWRQWRRAASRGSRRSGGRESGMSPAPPCNAIAQPISPLEPTTPFKFLVSWKIMEEGVPRIVQRCLLRNDI